MILSTSTISQRYEVIDIVYVFHQQDHKEGWFTAENANWEEIYPSIRRELALKADALGANAVIGITFNPQVATYGSGDTTRIVLEFSAFGTAVRIIE